MELTGPRPGRACVGVWCLCLCLFSHLQKLARVEREGVLGQTDLRVGVAELDLLGGLEDDAAVGVAHNRVLDHAVVARGHGDHLLGAHHHLLVVLADEGHGTNLHLRV